MKSKIAFVATLCAMVLSIGAFAAVNAPQTEVCVARSPETGGQRVGYELIDLMRREAWVTTNWTVEEYADFSPGLISLNWFKNDPRQGFAARNSVRRSPGCKYDGEFTYQTMFGRTFFHIADLSKIGQSYSTNGKITGGSVVKYHSLQFDTGQIVSILVSPAGERFVGVNRPVDAALVQPELPEGWSLQDVRLDGAWQTDLFGEILVLRLEDGTSYQGPIEPPPHTAKHDPRGKWNQRERRT